jgi:hypothetical protein
LGTWSKDYSGPIVKTKAFLQSNFYVSENFKFQCDPFSNLKDVSHKGTLPNLWGLSEMAYFIFGYFSTNLGISVDGHEQIII